MTKAATNEELAGLHKQVAESLKSDLEATEQIEDPAIRATVRKDLRSQIIQFLKNNNITAAKGNAELGELQAALAAQKARRPAPKGLSQEALDEAADLAAGRLQ